MYPKIEKIGDIFKLLNFGNPKRITFDLSENGVSYDTKIYIDIIDKSKDEEYEGYIQCKSSINSIENYPLIYDHNSEGAEIFTIIIPDEV